MANRGVLVDDKLLEAGSDLRGMPLYAPGVAAWYLQLHTVTLKRWVRGWEYRTKDGVRRSPPLIELPEGSDTHSGMLSFWNLVEGYVLRQIRLDHGVNMNKVREAIDYVSREFDTQHPLAHERFSTDGADLLIEQEGIWRVASRGGRQRIMNSMAPFLRRIKCPVDELASELRPLLRNREDPRAPEFVVIRPTMAGGRPVLEGTAAPTTTLAERFMAGESSADLMRDYGIDDLAKLEEAIRWSRGTKKVA